MATGLCLVFCLIITMTQIECNLVSRLQRIEDRLDGLQYRIDRESTYRREDTKRLFDKIGINSAMFNLSAIDIQCPGHADTNDMCTDWRRDFIQITKAFNDEKVLNSETRDRIPHFDDRMQTAEEALSRVEQTVEVSNGDIRDVATNMKTVLKEMNRNHIQLNNLVHEVAELKQVLLDSKDTQSCPPKTERFKSCEELYRHGHRVSGQYDVYPDARSDPIRVFCDQDTDGGGWTVFQRRKDGSEDFYRDWLEYKTGFGDLDGEFWLGNEYLNKLTSTCCHQLRIDMENFDGERRYAKYDTFQIRPEDEKYTLKVGGYSGNANDSMAEGHNGVPFSTKDRDQDSDSDKNCAEDYTGAWWYTKCYYSNLNGKYVGRKTDYNGINWYHWDGFNSLKFTEMKFK